MKKIIFTISLITSIISFSDTSKPQESLSDIEFKTMLHVGYEFPAEILNNKLIKTTSEKAFRISADGVLYKPFYVPKINTIFSLGLGASFDSLFNTTHYQLAVVPYISGEVAGYVNKDVRLYGGVDLGGLGYRSVKIGTYLGLTYKERFTTELSLKYPLSLMVGFGARFGYSRKPKVERTMYLNSAEYEKFKMEINGK